MSKIVRKVQKIFGINAGFQQIAEFGSLAAGTPSFTTDPATIQSLSNYLDGWFQAVLGNNSPAIEDMNALCYLFAYQLAYLMQEGIPEWEAGTTYFIGSMAQDGTGQVYTSIADNNLNNALTDTTKWKISWGATTGIQNQIGGINFTTIKVTNTNRTLDTTTTDMIVLVTTSSATSTLTLPTPTNGRTLIIKDIGGNAQVNNITLTPASGTIDGLSSYVINQAFASIMLTSDGTNWFIVQGKRNLGLVVNAHVAGVSGGGWSGAGSTSFVQMTQNNTNNANTLDVSTTDFGTPQTANGGFPRLTVNNLVPGIYRVQANFLSAVNSGAVQNGGYAINDGTTTRGQLVTSTASEANNQTIFAIFQYTTTGNKTFEIFSASTSGTADIPEPSVAFNNSILNWEIEKIG